MSPPASRPVQLRAPLTESGFCELADKVCAPREGVDRTTLWIRGETSDFVRFNNNLVRQATRVRQCEATLSVIVGQRRLSNTLTLGASLQANVDALRLAQQQLVHSLPLVPPDPHLVLPEAVSNTSRRDAAHAVHSGHPALDTVIDDIAAACDDVDMAGFLASGPGIAGFADSRGQRNWHEVHSMQLDWSIFLTGASERAIKLAIAGPQWDGDAFESRMRHARELLEPMSRPARPIAPGRYRAYLAPAAVNELLAGMAWSGFSMKDRSNGTSSLSQLQGSDNLADRQLNPLVNIAEATAGGMAPAFTDTGTVRPDQVSLIRAGQAVDCLVSLRSAAEFAATANAGSDESPHSLVMAGGQMPEDQALQALGTGLWIANLWYLNYSDRPNGRMTGMTRFACFWVENGRLKAPLPPMRFDESLLLLFGEKLEALTRETTLMPDTSTWGTRHLSAVTAPGMLVNNMTFTL